MYFSTQSLICTAFLCIIVSGNIVKENEDESLNNTTTCATYTYTLWINSKVSESYLMILKSPENSSFFDAMKQAAKIDPTFDFEAIRYPELGHYIRTIAGRTEDRQKRIHWMLYELPTHPDVMNPPKDDSLSPVGVDLLKINSGKHYLFWYKNIDDKCNNFVDRKQM